MEKDFLPELLKKYKTEIFERLKETPFAMTKKCDLCGFVCMEAEHTCRECGAYRFVPIEKDEIPRLSIELQEDWR